MNILGKAIVVAAIFAGGTSVSAATLTYDFTNQSTGGWVSSTSVASDEDATKTVTATGARFSEWTNSVTEGDSAVATWAGSGLGVCGNVSSRGYCYDSSHQVDGSGNNDLAVFDFGKDVSIEEIEFGYVNNTVTQHAKYKWKCTSRKRNGRCKSGYWKKVSNEVTATERFELFADENGILQFIQSTVIGDTGGDTQETALLSNAIDPASRFGIGARGSYDAFKIRSITVSHDMAAVPLPASGLMLVGAIAGFGALRRRRKAA